MEPAIRKEITEALERSTESGELSSGVIERSIGLISHFGKMPLSINRSHIGLSITFDEGIVEVLPEGTQISNLLDRIGEWTNKNVPQFEFGEIQDPVDRNINRIYVEYNAYILKSNPVDEYFQSPSTIVGMGKALKVLKALSGSLEKDRLRREKRKAEGERHAGWMRRHGCP